MYTVCYAPQGGLLATAHLDGSVRVWQATDVALRAQFEVKGRFIYGAMSFSPDGLWLATGAMNGTVALWDPLTGKTVWDSGRHQGYVYTVGFGRDSRTLVSGGVDGVCYQWSLQPPGRQSDKEFADLWDSIRAEDGRTVYQAIWSFSSNPDRAVALIGTKLRPVKTVIDLQKVLQETSGEETKRRKRLIQLLVEKEEKTERLIVVRRAVELLAQFGTPAAIQLLKELVSKDDRRIRQLATAALNRARLQRQ